MGEDQDRHGARVSRGLANAISTERVADGPRWVTAATDLEGVDIRALDGYGALMARMTPEEATAVNVLCSYVAGLSQPIPDQVAKGLETLASRAHNRLHTGWDENAVRKQWSAAFPTPATPATRTEPAS